MDCIKFVMSEKRILEQTVETLTASRQWPQIEATPYKAIARYLFVAGFAAGIGLSSWVGAVSYLDLFFSGVIAGLVAQGGTVIYIGYVTSRIYQQDRVVKTERFAHEPDPEIAPARITGNGYTTNIMQPEAGAFAKWARDVLNPHLRVQFSGNEALERGFDLKNVLGELDRIGALQKNPDGNGVYRLTDSGKKLLEEWLK